MLTYSFLQILREESNIKDVEQAGGQDALLGRAEGSPVDF